MVPHLGRDDRLHDRGQGRVAGGQRVVVLEVGELHLGGEPVALEVEREHHVGLLEHLEAVDDQRVVVQQQRPAVSACARGPTAPSRGTRSPAGGCRACSSNGMCMCAAARRQLATSAGVTSRRSIRRLVAVGVVHLQVVDGRGRGGEVRPRHDVRVQVVVHDGRVLVGPGDAVDVEHVVGVRAPEAEVLPHAGGLDEDVDRAAREEVLVARGRDVLAQRDRRCRRRCGTARCPPRSTRSTPGR